MTVEWLVKVRRTMRAKPIIRGRFNGEPAAQSMRNRLVDDDVDEQVWIDKVTTEGPFHLHTKAGV